MHPACTQILHTCTQILPATQCPPCLPPDEPTYPLSRAACPPAPSAPPLTSHLAPAGNVSHASTSGREQRKFWTDNPDKTLVENSAKIKERLDAVKKEQLRSKSKKSAKKSRKESKIGDGGAQLKRDGEWLESLTGNRDFSFFQPLPEAGAKVVLIRCLCNKYELSLADGDATLSGAFVEAFGRALGEPYHLILSNISMVCHRKGEGGVEPLDGQAGCEDPTEERLEVLAMVKELQYLGLLAAGLDVVAIIASSNASIASFGNLESGKHFMPQEGTGTYKGVPIYTAPHPKYISPKCRFTSSVARALGVPLGDSLAVTSAVLDGWSCIAASIASLHPFEGESTEDSEDFEAYARMVYEALRDDDKSGVVAREWELRYTTTTSPETQAKLEAALGEHFRAMHAAITEAMRTNPGCRS